MCRELAVAFIRFYSKYTSVGGSQGAPRSRKDYMRQTTKLKKDIERVSKQMRIS